MSDANCRQLNSSLRAIQKHTAPQPERERERRSPFGPREQRAHSTDRARAYQKIAIDCLVVVVAIAKMVAHFCAGANWQSCYCLALAFCEFCYEARATKRKFRPGLCDWRRAEIRQISSFEQNHPTPTSLQWLLQTPDGLAVGKPLAGERRATCEWPNRTCSSPCACPMAD